jgi:hypothetical protein
LTVVALTHLVARQADHVRWMTHGGIHAYGSSYPQVWIQVFFVILVVVDPLVAVLLGMVRREGIWLACGVMVLDVVANWVGNWARIRHHPGLNVPWVITLFGVFVLATAPPLLLLWRKGAAVNLKEA